MKGDLATLIQTSQAGSYLFLKLPSNPKKLGIRERDAQAMQSSPTSPTVYWNLKKDIMNADQVQREQRNYSSSQVDMYKKKLQIWGLSTETKTLELFNLEIWMWKEFTKHIDKIMNYKCGLTDEILVH